jgi:hypothetical protein
LQATLQNLVRQSSATQSQQRPQRVHFGNASRVFVGGGLRQISAMQQEIELRQRQVSAQPVVVD